MAVPQDVDLTGEVGIAHGQADHEAVQLGLGQELRTCRAHGVLGGDNGKGRRQRVRDTVHCDLALLHHLQQGRLGLAGGTVDLVSQEKIGHNRAGLIYKVTCFLAIQGEAHDVRREDIRRKLDAPVAQTQRPVKGQSCRGLTGARHIIQQHMAPGKQGHEYLFQNLILADDDLVYLCEYLTDIAVHRSLLYHSL